jgi:protein disulfide-isomerase
MLDRAMKEGAAAPLIARDFKVVKVDVGKFDRNLDVAESYGVPLKKGIPAVAVVTAGNKAIYATRAGELADARKMGETGVYEFFRRISVDIGSAAR